MRTLEVIEKQHGECPVVEILRENDKHEQIGLSEILLEENLFFPPRYIMLTKINVDKICKA